MSHMNYQIQVDGRAAATNGLLFSNNLSHRVSSTCKHCPPIVLEWLARPFWANTEGDLNLNLVWLTEFGKSSINNGQ